MASNKTEQTTPIAFDFVDVRVLSTVELNGKKINPGPVINIPADLAQSMIEDGLVDANVEAVAYALTEYPVVIFPFL